MRERKMGLKVNLKQISAFRSVMISGSTSGAAELLNISQSAVSRLIQNLEAQTAFPLFLRQNGRLYPTPEALAFLEEVEQVYSRLDHLGNVMGNIRMLESGHLRVIVSTPFAQWLLPEALARFRKKRPDIRVSVEIVVRRDMPKWLEEQKFDVALITFPVDYPVAHLRNLPSLNAVCILPLGHPLADVPVVRARDLAGQPFISIIPNTVPRMKIDQIFSQLSIQRSVMIEIQTGASICSLVAAGLGVAIVDPVTVGRPEGKKFIVKAFRPTIRFDFGMLLPIQRPVSSHADEFIGIVREQMNAFQQVCKAL
ncbi:LysR substrate-binding domain-containing protein [Paralcaligenes sp. KSB-10]|uniref:LysR substrate-binding domain-containing protein n=1 Tax=Paralcaligenes sp. KSB-10 TaxID=2901142 RepID=UPI001E3B686B|nr:LysR substrate-binding domain-containing protein [Paralcaligenes sp. KSB-10]UHL65450.1 LysR substrate-binding domain-containing protein [Paralcaligenes sp. KSB-10]